jgi:hypothetical protein
MPKKIPVWDSTKREILKWIEVEKLSFEDILLRLLEELAILKDNYYYFLDIRKYNETVLLCIKIGNKIIAEYLIFIDREKDEASVEKVL